MSGLICIHCYQPVRISPRHDGQYVHAGGGAVLQQCEDCGWYGGKSGDAYEKCPKCKSEDLTDLHTVKPGRK